MEWTRWWGVGGEVGEGGHAFKLMNPELAHRTERQSLVDSVSLSFLVCWPEINNCHAKFM